MDGLQRRFVMIGGEKCYDPQDTTFTFVDEEDTLDFLWEDFQSRRAKMSCGHAVTPTSLTNWCRKLLKDGKSRFQCGICGAEWPYDEVCKMALLSPNEMKEFEEKTFSNAANNHLDIKACPGCKSPVMRTDLQDLSVVCSLCTTNNRRLYKFCWQCLREWKGSAPRSDRCENDGCINPTLDRLKTCPDIVFKDVKGVSGCPSFRACPTCGILIQHDGTLCKDVVCRCCRVKFCFVCLKITKECHMLKPNSRYRGCSTGVAPRQTSIPVWKWSCS